MMGHHDGTYEAWTQFDAENLGLPPNAFDRSAPKWIGRRLRDKRASGCKVALPRDSTYRPFPF